MEHANVDLFNEDPFEFEDEDPFGFGICTLDTDDPSLAPAPVVASFIVGSSLPALHPVVARRIADNRRQAIARKEEREFGASAAGAEPHDSSELIARSSPSPPVCLSLTCR